MALMVACGGSDDGPTPGTRSPEGRHPVGAVDFATLYVAIYDAVLAIVGTDGPFADAAAGTAPAGAPQEAAVAATVQELAWAPSVPTLKHPEYPLAHLCVNGVAEVGTPSENRRKTGDNGRHRDRYFNASFRKHLEEHAR